MSSCCPAAFSSARHRQEVAVPLRQQRAFHDGDEQGAEELLQRDEGAGGATLPRARDWGRPPLRRASASDMAY